MKHIIAAALCFIALLLFCGCQEQNETANGSAEFSQNSFCVPAKIAFNQLTEFAAVDRLEAYIDITDKFGSRIKAPAIWRFELYKVVPRSAEPKGARVYMWENIDLTDAAENNKLWQDYLRCYKFQLDMDTQIEAGQNYILQAVCLNANGRRIINTIELAN